MPTRVWCRSSSKQGAVNHGALLVGRLRGREPRLAGTVSPLTSKPERWPRGQMRRGVHDHLSALAIMLGISDAEGVDRLMYEEPQSRVGRLV
jgi:hypothetical protein